MWNKEFNNFLQTYNLLVSDDDVCVYVNKCDPKLIIAIWVDDGICCSVMYDIIVDILNYMEGPFEITKGLAEIFVGLHNTRDRDQKVIHLDQRRYLDLVLLRFRHEHSNPVAVPANPNSATEPVMSNESTVEGVVT